MIIPRRKVRLQDLGGAESENPGPVKKGVCALLTHRKHCWVLKDDMGGKVPNQKPNMPSTGKLHVKGLSNEK